MEDARIAPTAIVAEPKLTPPSDVKLDRQSRFGGEWWWLVNRFSPYQIDSETVDANLRKLVKRETLSPQEIGGLFHWGMIAKSTEIRNQAAELIMELINSNPNFLEMQKVTQATFLLFSDWHKTDNETQLRIIKKYGEPVIENFSIIPASGVGVRTSDTQWNCGEMEDRMLMSKKRTLIGERMLMKYFGSAGVITDRLTVFTDGNVVLPFFWYTPDSYFVEQARSRPEGQDPKIIDMSDFTTIALIPMRNSPAFYGDEGSDFKHENFKPAEFRSGLTKLIETANN